jgi:hypothetical protein
VADAIKAKTDNLPADPADDSDIDSQLAAIAAYVDTEVAAILAAVDTEVAAIKAKTDNLPPDPADQSAVESAITSATSGLATSAALATVDGNVDAILADTNELQTNQGNWLTADVSGLATAAAVGALNDLSAAEVNAEMDTAISDAGLATAADLAAVDGIVDDILADTDELQANQGAWATADVSGLATSAEVGALNNLSAQQVWEYVTRELTSAGANGATAQEVWEYATRELTGTAGATPQQVWEYATRELTAGTRDNEIDAIADDLHDIVTSGVTSILVASPVRGRAATVYQYATWDTEFALSEAPDLTGFENVIFAVKDNENQADTDAILYVDTATGLKYIGGAAASSANAGSLVISSATKFVVCVGKDEVAAKLASRFNGGFTWFLKGIETSSLPNKAVFIASGIWSIEKGGIRAVG